MSSEIEFRILGPLTVIANGKPVPLGGLRQRAVLALLLTRPNEVVSTDRLIDELWEAHPPRTALNTIHYYVSQLRKLLGAERIVTRPPGYSIRVDRHELDLLRFEDLLQHEDADSLHLALALWQGQALADLADEPFARDEIVRLEELRVVAFERRVDTDLELGRHAELVSELETMVALHPLRERLRGQLMLALYRAGRQAEALAAYRTARATLVDELGIEPNPALQELERAMLRQDPSLDASRSDGGVSPERSILVAPSQATRLNELLLLAEPLAKRPPRALIVSALVSAGSDLVAATKLLSQQRDLLVSRGVPTRVAAYTSTTPGEDVALLATEQDVDLVLLDAPEGMLEAGDLGPGLAAVLGSAPCDVGVLAKGELLQPERPLPVVVPFGGIEHDWCAVELAAWLALSLGTGLRLAGTSETGERRDASRLLARASLIVQAALGIVAEPTLVPAGPAGVLEAAEGATLLVVGLSERWRLEGLGEARLAVVCNAHVPTLLVRHGLRPGGLAPAETMSRFTWTLADR